MPNRAATTQGNIPPLFEIKGGKRLVYVLQGNASFVRLLTALIAKLDDYEYQVYSLEELPRAVESRRPHLLAVIEKVDAYRQVRAMTECQGLPILFVSIADQDSKNTPKFPASDRSWLMKNNPEELTHVLDSLTGETPAIKRILCVDDSQTILNHLKKAFIGTPYAITTAENGQDALDRLTDFTPDLIITDVEMPVMDGLTFCRKVRARTMTSETPLIILSSRMDHKTIADGFESGADEYLTKPFFPDELLNKVESYLVPPPARRQEQILVVSENQNVIHQLKQALSKQGFVVTTHDNPEEACEAALKDAPDLIISDWEIAGTTGFQICTKVRELPVFKKTPFVVITGKTSSGARKMGRKVGVTAYLTKPFTRESLVTLVERLLAEQRSLSALEWDMVLATITSLARALDERDPYTRFHSENVSRAAVAIGRKAGLNSLELENLRLAGLLHDIGKIGVPDKVLHKPGRLTDEEFEMIKEHSKLGSGILQPLPGLEEVLPGILHHHERLDGQGYPDGLKGNEIPVFAQILAVADTYDALVTDRPYRQGLPQEKARTIMMDASGTQLSPYYVKLLFEWLDESA